MFASKRVDTGFSDFWTPKESRYREDRSRGYADAYEGLPASGSSAAYSDGYEACRKLLVDFVPSMKAIESGA